MIYNVNSKTLSGNGSRTISHDSTTTSSELGLPTLMVLYSLTWMTRER